MNLMGKILTLLIFFLSICFLVIAVMVGAAHQNWQEQANENKVVAERAQSLLDQARNPAFWPGSAAPATSTRNAGPDWKLMSMAPVRITLRTLTWPSPAMP